MDLPMDMKKQLMAMAGITDVEEFDLMASKIAIGKANCEAQVKNPRRNSPFQVHFVQILALLDAQESGKAKFDAMNEDIQGQISYVHDIIDSYPDYQDMKKFIDTLEEATPKSSKEKAEISLTFRDRGNKAYSKKDFEVALNSFSQSALTGPLDQAGHGREVAIALANRSAVHFEMENWQRCLDDTEAALLFGYPEELQFKLFERRGRCLTKLQRPSEARLAFELAMTKLEASKLDPKKRENFLNETSKKIEMDLSIPQEDKPVDSEEEWRKCPFDIWERNKNFPPLSDALGIGYSEKGGRHIYATRSIEAGEAIVIEEPTVAHLSPCFMPSNCVHCLRRNGVSVLPSPLNLKARFCSLTCLQSAMDSYHQIESKIDINRLFYNNEHDQMSGCISLAYRAITQKGLTFFLENRDKLFGQHDIKFGLECPPDFVYQGEQHYKGLYNLVTHVDGMSSEDRQAFAVRSAILLKCLIASDFFPKTQSKQLTKDQLYIGELLFHFQTGIQYNLHAIYQVSEKEIEPGKKIPLTDIGAGCYPTTIFFNHSCSPNTVRINQGKRVVYVAKRNISAGDQVTDCYGIHHLYMGLEERQEALLRGYMFQCQCQACLSNYGTLAQLPALISPNIALKLGNTMTKYKECFIEGKVKKALKCCQDYLGKLEELKIIYPHRNYEIAAVALCSCLWSIATRKNC